MGVFQECCEGFGKGQNLYTVFGLQTISLSDLRAFCGCQLCMPPNHDAIYASWNVLNRVWCRTGNPVACDQVAHRWIKAFIGAGYRPAGILVDARDAAHASSADSDEVYDFV